MKFVDLGLEPQIVKPLLDKGYKSPTPVQIKTIPEIIKRRDIFGEAPNGTGKTAAYMLPIIQLIQKIEAKAEKPILRCLNIVCDDVMVPKTRDKINHYTKQTQVKHKAIMKDKDDIDASQYQDKHILTMTKSIFEKVMQANLIDFETVKVLIVDDIEKIESAESRTQFLDLINKLPQKRQNIIFCNENKDQIREQIIPLLHDPVTLKVDKRFVPHDKRKPKNKNRRKNNNLSSQKKNHKGKPQKKGRKDLPQSLKSKFMWPLE